MRTNNAQVALAAGQKLQACSDPEEAELAAILFGLSELAKYYSGKLCVETDCSSIPGLLCDSGTNQSALFPLVTDTKQIMKEFKEVTICYARRSSNRMAHELAALTRRQGNFTTIGDVPLSLRNILVDDCKNHSVVI